MSKLLSINNLKKNYNTINGEIEAIKDISIDINEGDFIAIVGSSGCGKSTLLSIICDLENKTDGEIIFYKDNPIIGYMLQEDALFNHLTIKDNIILGLKILGIDNDDNIDYAINLLNKYEAVKKWKPLFVQDDGSALLRPGGKCFKTHFLALVGKSDTAGKQHRGGVFVPGTVLVVAQQRETPAGKLHTDLVGSSRMKANSTYMMKWGRK